MSPVHSHKPPLAKRLLAVEGYAYEVVSIESEHEFQTLVPHMGSCIASDMITVQGLKVAYMYREEAQSSDESGWVFLSGEEGDDYIEDPENLGLYEVNVIANYDADIIAHLNAPAGSHFARNEQGVFERIDFEAMDLE